MTEQTEQTKQPNLKRLMDGVFTPEDIGDGIKKAIGGFGLPKWLLEERSCPECGKPIPLEGNFGFGVKLNAQHFGNFFVETLCPNCHSGFEWHFKKACPTFKDLLNVMTSGSGDQPVPNHRIPSSENNLIEAMLKDKKEKK
jgi:hypothetical protein